MTIDGPVTDVKGVGEELAKKLAGFGVHTVYDLIELYPRRYDDYSELSQIKSLLRKKGG